MPVRLARNLAALMAGLLVVVLAGSAWAAEYPARPQGPVYDGADMISPATEAALDENLRDYNRQTGRALVVATVPSLDGAAIEQYATGLFADWGIGGAERDQGLLLLISRDDRKMRIEVGYGLHPYFGGIMAGRVIRDTITPRFKQGDFDGGITAGIDVIEQHLAKSPAEAAAIEEAARTAEAQNQSQQAGMPVGTIIWIIFLVFFFILPMFRRRRGGRRYGAGDTLRDVIVWNAINSAMNSGSHHRDGWGGGGFGGGGGLGGGGGGGFGGFGGGMSGGGGASGGW